MKKFLNIIRSTFIFTEYYCMILEKKMKNKLAMTSWISKSNEGNKYPNKKVIMS